MCTVYSVQTFLYCVEKVWFLVCHNANILHTALFPTCVCWYHNTNLVGAAENAGVHIFCTEQLYSDCSAEWWEDPWHVVLNIIFYYRLYWGELVCKETETLCHWVRLQPQLANWAPAPTWGCKVYYWVCKGAVAFGHLWWRDCCTSSYSMRTLHSRS